LLFRVLFGLCRGNTGSLGGTLELGVGEVEGGHGAKSAEHLAGTSIQFPRSSGLYAPHMRRGKQGRQQFFEAHPICCFCGGEKPAVEEDHFPSRSLFRGHHWPEGYVFPACVECNRITRRDELIVAWLARARVLDGPRRKLDEDDFERRCAAVNRRFPGLLESMQSGVTLRERRTVRDKLGMQMPPDSSLLDVPVLSITDVRIQNAVLNFGRKFGLALFYKEFGAPMPIGGAVGVRWYSNFQVETGEIPATLSEALPHRPPVMRAKVDLSDQFAYRVGTAQDNGTRIGIYRADFRTAFAIVAPFSDRRSAIAPAGSAIFDKVRLYSPYSHAK
jgi:hypothetical protein